MSQPQATTVVRRAEPCEAATIKPLLNSSLRKLDPFTHPTTDDPSTPDYPYFDSYWSEAGRTPYLIQSGDQTAGFDLIRTPASTHTAFHQVAEFYIDPNFRRARIRTQAIRKIWQHHPDPWQPRYHPVTRSAKGIIFRHVHAWARR